MISTELINSLSKKLSTDFNTSTRKDWIKYIQNSKSKRNPLSEINIRRLALTEHVHKLNLTGRTLFHLTTTYKKFEEKVYRESDINTFFINFYTKRFLPYLVGTKNIGRENKKIIQPLTYVFVDEHEMKAVKKPIFNSQNIKFQYSFPTRLHHHAILAVHESTLDKMKLLEGINTLNNEDFSPIIMTSDIRKCDAQCLLYSSKMLHKYEDFMMFPD